MSKFLLAVCAFGLLFSSALAQEKSPEQLREERGKKSSGPVSFLLEQTSGSAFSTGSTPIAPPAAMLMSVSPNNRNTAAPRLQLQAISPSSQKTVSALDATSTRFAAYNSITSRQRNTSATMN
jgi:hypothetical protein